MNYTGRVASFAAVILLIVAAERLAECAWVLWRETSYPGSSAWWLLDSAQPALRDCERALDEHARVLHRQNYLLSDTLGQRVLTATKGDIRMMYFCLPDTMDPRGPKVK